MIDNDDRELARLDSIFRLSAPEAPLSRFGGTTTGGNRRPFGRWLSLSDEQAGLVA
jgi:hypothetical protein